MPQGASDKLVALQCRAIIHTKELDRKSRTTYLLSTSGQPLKSQLRLKIAALEVQVTRSQPLISIQFDVKRYVRRATSMEYFHGNDPLHPEHSRLLEAQCQTPMSAPRALFLQNQQNTAGDSNIMHTGNHALAAGEYLWA